MKSTRVVALAALLACLPVRAVELIDLHDPVLLPAHPPAYFPSHFLELPADEWGDVPWAAGQPGAPAEPLPPVAASPATPVPEPVAVMMLAAGLLLMVPGAWVARWSRLGDDESLLQRRLP